MAPRYPSEGDEANRGDDFLSFVILLILLGFVVVSESFFPKHATNQGELTKIEYGPRSMGVGELEFVIEAGQVVFERSWDLGMKRLCAIQSLRLRGEEKCRKSTIIRP